MKEYLTEAVVLNFKPYREQDRLLQLYTKDFGRLKVKVTGGRKILSKLSPHLDVFNLVTVRLIKKSNFILADVLTKDRFLSLRSSLEKRGSACRLFFLIVHFAPELVPDLPLWHYLVRALKNARINLALFLKLLGYDPSSAYCEICRLKTVHYFNLSASSFLCGRCGLKFPESELIFLG